MSGRLGNYLELVRQAQQKRVQITREQEKEIRSLYREIARSLEKELRRYNPDSLTYRWLKDYAKSLRQESKSLFQEISSIAAISIQNAAGAVTEAERSFYTKACPALSERFSDVFSTIPRAVVEELMSGGIYRDFAGLSERIWDYRRKYDRDIQTILNRGISQQTSAYELAKDLERYLNPSAQKPWNWGNVYPGVNRVVDYNAQRLARTAVTHAYQLAFQRATKDNPFVEAYRWHSSNSGRVCELCRERNGQLYEKDSLPLDHPNGMCVVTGEISKSLKEIGEELGDWAAGRTQNPELDKWLNSDTIKVETYRKKSSTSNPKFRYLSDDEFNRLIIPAKKRGAIIIRGTEEVERHLEAQGASASTLGNILLFRKNVILSDVLEEIHHFEQNLSGLNNEFEEPLRSILNEIDVKQFLIENAKKHRIPRIELEQTQAQLASYKELLEKEREKHG